MSRDKTLEGSRTIYRVNRMDNTWQSYESGWFGSWWSNVADNNKSLFLMQYT